MMMKVLLDSFFYEILYEIPCFKKKKFFFNIIL